MSKQVDERVVSLSFDNKRFENNVSQSMSTLDKLKQKLNLSGASKGLEAVDAAARKVDMNGLANGVERVRITFSSMIKEAMGITAVANITNSLVNSLRQMGDALLVAPKKEGFQEYEMVLKAVQTTMAGTGKTAEEVQKELDKLDEYADKTIYSTSDMLNNLPKFTNAGVELETATTAMIGIANATALAGGDANKASIAFYNLGQAIGTGYLTRMDYNSINNAGIATMEWKKQMTEAAIAAGTLTKAGDDLYSVGGKTMSLQQLFIDGLQYQWATKDVMLKVFGDYGDAQTEVGKKAYDAAQNVKTYTMMMESLKATAGTGWKNTWQIIFGDLDAATKMWTRLTNFISGILTGLADIRNGILSSALGKGFTELGKKVKGVLKPIQSTAKTIETITEAVKDYGKVVDEIIHGDWGNGQARWNKLTEAGYDWAHAQNLVNEKLGDATRHATNYAEAQNGVAKAQENSTEAQEGLTKADAELLEQLLALSDAELEAKGYTKEQIAAFRELESVAKKLGLPISEFIENLDRINGRWLMVEGFANIGKSLIGVFNAMKQAWNEIFETGDVSIMDRIANAIFNITAAFHKFTRKLVLSEGNFDKLKRTFKGLFAIVDILITLIKGPLNLVFGLFGKISAECKFNILDITAAIGDAIVKFRDWFKVAYKDWIAKFKQSKFYKAGMNIIDGLVKGIKDGTKTVWNAIVKLAKSLLEKFKDILGIHSPSRILKIGKNIIQGLVNGIKELLPKVGETIKSVASTLLDSFKNDLFPALAKIIPESLNAIVRLIQAINFKNIVIGGFSFAIIKFLLAFTKAFSGLTNALEGAVTKFGNMFQSVSTAINKVGEMFDNIGEAKKLEAKAELVRSLAITIGVIAASIFVLSRIDTAKMWSCVGAIAVIGAVMIALVAAIHFLTGGAETSDGDDEKITEKTKNFGKTTANILKLVGVLIAVSVAFVALAAALKIISTLSFKELLIGALGLFVMTGIIVGLLLVLNELNATGGRIGKIGSTILKLSISILVLAFIAKILSTLQFGKVVKGGLAVLAIGAIFAALIFVIKMIDKDVDKVGGTLLKMAAAMLIMAIVVKALSMVSPENLITGTIAIAAFAGIIAGLIYATNLAGPNLRRIGSTVFAMSLGILAMAGAVVLLGMLDPKKIITGTVALALFAGIIVGLIAATNLAGGGGSLKRVAITMLSISISIAVLAAIALLLGFIDPARLAKGIIAVGALALIVAGLLAATKLGGGGLKRVPATMLAVSASIAIMAIIATVLGFVDTVKLTKGIIAVGLLAAIVAGLLIVTKLTDDSCIKPLLLITAAITLMAVAVGVLSYIKAGKLALAMTVIAVMGGVIAGLLEVLANIEIETDDLTQAGIAIGGMIVAMALLTLLVWWLSIMDAKKALPNVIALTILMAAMTGLLYPLMIIGEMVFKGCGKGLLGLAALLLMVVPMAALIGMLCWLQHVDVAKEKVMAIIDLMTAMTILLVPLMIIGEFLFATYGAAALGIAALAAMVGPMAAFIGMLCWMQNVDVAKEKVKALIDLMTAMTVLLVPLMVIGLAMFASYGICAIGILALAAMVGPMAAFLGMLAWMQNIKGAAANCYLLSYLMTSMGDVLFKISLVAPLAVGAVGALMGLSLITVTLMALCVKIGEMMEQNADIEKFVNLGIPLLIKMAEGVGEMLGVFIGGIITGVASRLPAVGENLSAFMEGAQPFIEGVKQVDKSVLTGIGILAAAIFLLTAVDFLTGIMSFMTYGSSFVDLGTQLSKFMSKALPFILGMNLVKPELMTGIKTLAEAILILTGANLLDRISVFLGAGSSLTKFASELAPLGAGLKAFKDSLGTFTDADVTTVDCAGKAIKALAEAADAIPAQGGWLDKIIGTSSLAAFGDNLPDLALNLSAFVKNLDGFAGKEAAAESAGKVITALATAAKELPNEGGWAAKILGDNSLATFGEGLPELGTNLRSFIKNLGTFDESYVTSVDCAGKVITALATAAKEIPNEGGWVAKILGDNSLATFGEKLPEFGSHLKSFVTNLGTFNNDQVGAVDRGCEIIKTITSLGQINLGDASSGIKKLGETMVSFAKEIKSFVGVMNEITAEAISSTVDKINKLIDLITSAISVDTESLKAFGESLKSVGVDGVKAFVDAVGTEDLVTKVKDAAKAMLDNFVTGAKDCQDTVNKDVTDIVSNAIKALDTKEMTESYKTAGKNVVIGFANGIEDNLEYSSIAGKKLGKAALEAAMKVLNEHSPSREMYKVGDYAGIGFVNALYDNVSKAYAAGREMAGAALNSTRSTMARIVDAINSDMDAQPTIRPVLDLTDVRSGVNSIGDMLSGSRTLAVNTSGINAVSASMTNRQNGNYELASALNKLARNNGKSGDTYNFNGFSYNEDSDVAGAIQTLVRAAKMEGRT